MDDLALSWFRMVEMVWNRGMAPIQSQEDLTPTKNQTKARRIGESLSHTGWFKRFDAKVLLSQVSIALCWQDNQQGRVIWIVFQALNCRSPQEFLQFLTKFYDAKVRVAIYRHQNRETVSRLVFVAENSFASPFPLLHSPEGAINSSKECHTVTDSQAVKTLNK